MGDGPHAGSTIRRYVIGAIVLVALVVLGKGGALKQKLLDKLHGVSGRAESVAVKATASAPTGKYTLPGLRKALNTSVGEGQRDDTPAPEPPSGVLEKVTYSAPLGRNVAYVTPVRSGARGPAIVWIVGGFGFGIDQGLWETAPRDNDQTAAAFRKAGIAQMFPALRGASQNPGHHECFLGEVDDILAATDFLAQRPDVDPARILPRRSQHWRHHGPAGRREHLALSRGVCLRPRRGHAQLRRVRLRAGRQLGGRVQGARADGVPQRDRLADLHHRGHEER